MDKEITMQEVIIDVSKNANDITTLTKNIETLTNTVTVQSIQTNKAIEHMGNNLNANIQQLSSELGKQAIESAGRGKLNWHTFASICGVGIGVLSLTVTVMVVLGSMALDPVKQNVNKIEERQTESIYLFRDSIEKAETRMQRESDYKYSDLLDRIKKLEENIDKKKM
jgi:hypothetical protein